MMILWGDYIRWWMSNCFVYIINTIIWSPKFSCLQPVGTSRWSTKNIHKGCSITVIVCFVFAIRTGVGTCSLSPAVFEWLWWAFVVAFTLDWFAFIVLVVRSGCVLCSVCLFNSDITPWNWVIIWFSHAWSSAACCCTLFVISKSAAGLIVEALE